jgi:hypothetical protein
MFYTDLMNRMLKDLAETNTGPPVEWPDAEGLIVCPMCYSAVPSEHKDAHVYRHAYERDLKRIKNAYDNGWKA